MADHTDWYEQDRNPLRAWLVYLECRRHRLQIPKWVLEYFERVSVVFDTWTRGGAPQPTAPAILRAMEMRRAKGTVFARLKDSERDFVLASMLQGERLLSRNRKQRAKAKRVAADAKAAGIHASRQTIDRAMKKFRDAGFDQGRLVG